MGYFEWVLLHMLSFLVFHSESSLGGQQDEGTLYGHCLKAQQDDIR